MKYDSCSNGYVSIPGIEVAGGMVIAGSNSRLLMASHNEGETPEVTRK